MLNVVVLTGRLVANPELKHTSNDLAVTSFTVAVNRKFSRAGEEKATDFIDIVAWRSTAEFVCKYFRKGNLIAIEGSIQVRNYQDKDGNKRKAFEVIANNVHFVESKKDAQNSAGSYIQDRPNENDSENDSTVYSSGSDEDFQLTDNDDDLPF